ncbi:hypothetical protein [Micromonospora sp. NPDC049679]|uniref:hypothetical protein n=1 Tax=Micromonospora sp. NPDC049679 TaxID=3155920 RepID=UPI0034008651
MRTLPAVTLIGSLAVLPLGLAACGSDDGNANASGGSWESPKVSDGNSESPKAVSDGAAESRQVVQTYLEAMTDKDVAKGRAQLCEPLRAAFDKTATSPNGDFSAAFTVDQAKVTGARVVAGKHEVTTSARVVAKSRKVPVNIVFTVTNADGWCIANEKLGGTPTPTPAAS